MERVLVGQPTTPQCFHSFFSAADLQYLDWPDFCKYIQTLQQARGHVLNDPSHLSIVHQQHLTSSKADSKKEIGYVLHIQPATYYASPSLRYKERVLYYLLSHVNGRSPEAVKLSILRCLQGVFSGKKFLALLPSWETISAPGSTQAGATREISVLLLASADETAAKSVNDDNSSAWATYIKTLRHCFHKGVWQQSLSLVFSNHRIIQNLPRYSELRSHMACNLACSPSSILIARSNCASCCWK